jgi:hypothetical protein
MHAANDHESWDRKERIYELLKCLFDQFPTNNIKTLFGEVTVNYVGGDIFKQTTQDDNIMKLDMKMGLLYCVKKKCQDQNSSYTHKVACIHIGSSN